MESVFFGISIALNLLAVFSIRNLLKRVAVLEDLNDALIGKLDEIQSGLVVTIEKMREIDLRGAFESNDQVGFVFKAMLAMVNELEKYLESVNATE